MNIKKFLGTKEFYKEALSVAIPLMVQQLIMSSVNLVDNLMVGQLGDAAIGGVGVANRYYMIAFFTVNGFVTATSIYIAQFFGANDNDRLKQTFRFSTVISVVLMLLFFALAFFNPDLIINFFTDETSYIIQAELYMKYVVLSYLPAVVTMVIANALRTLGEAKLPLFANVVAVFVNCFFNYILIFGHLGLPAMGVQGAAVATFISRVIECVILLLAVIRYDFPFKTKIRDLFKFETSLMKTITVKAIPLVTNELLWSFGQAMLLKLYATRGADVITAYSVSGTITDIFFSLFGGMAAATTIMVGQRLGANKLDEARTNAHNMIAFSVVLAVLFGVVMFGSSYIIPNFYDLTPETKVLATNLIRVCGCLFWIYMLNTEIYFILRTGGDTKATLIMDSCFMWVINIPLLAVLAYMTDLNIYVIYITGQLTDLLKLFIASHFYKKGRWVKNLTVTE